MMKPHCDHCGDEIKRDRRHLWANSLPKTDRMRNMSMTVEFHVRTVNGNTKDKADICDKCFNRFIDAMVEERRAKV